MYVQVFLFCFILQPFNDVNKIGFYMKDMPHMRVLRKIHGFTGRMLPYREDTWFFREDKRCYGRDVSLPEGLLGMAGPSELALPHMVQSF